MSEFIAQAAAYKPGETLPWLEKFQALSREDWQKKAFPHRKTEHWRYTNLRAIEQGDFFAHARPEQTISDELPFRHDIAQLNAHTLVFVDGHYQTGFSSDSSSLPDGLEIIRFATANDVQKQRVLKQLGSVAKSDPHLFVALNNSQLNDGVYICVRKNCRLDKPVRILTLTTGQATPFSITPRVFMQLEEGSEAVLVEHYASDERTQSCFVNAVTELDIQNNARLTHYRLHLEDESALHIGGVHANLHRDAMLNSFHLALGGELKRLDLVVNHLGKAAHCELNGVYLPRNKQHVDYHTCIEHVAPACTTNEVFRGIISDNAKAVFNGRIHIHRDAQKTLAQLSNKNLLTSDKAEVDTKPELEIYADDVQCAHGATVAQLDRSAMHYMLTRGVSPEEAKVMLSFGFINELVNQINHEAIAEFVRLKLSHLFAHDPDLLRHLS